MKKIETRCSKCQCIILKSEVKMNRYLRFCEDCYNKRKGLSFASPDKWKYMKKKKEAKKQ